MQQQVSRLCDQRLAPDVERIHAKKTHATSFLLLTCLLVVVIPHCAAWLLLTPTRTTTKTTAASKPITTVLLHRSLLSTTEATFAKPMAQLLPPELSRLHRQQHQRPEQPQQRQDVRVTSSRTVASMTATMDNPTTSFPELGDDGIYNILNKEQHEVFVEANRDKIIVLKLFAPWCRACKGLHPKFLAITQDDKYKPLPLVWAQLSVQHNKEFIKSIGVMALPTVQFYIGGTLLDTFPCGPSKVPILKRKLAQVVNEHVDPGTLQVKASSIERALLGKFEAAPAGATDKATSHADKTASTEDAISKDSSTKPANATVESKPTWTSTSEAPLISLQERMRFRKAIPHMSSMNIADFDLVMDKARLLTFDAGSVIMREGKPGRTFYIITDGEVEICQRTFAEDPLQSGAWYLGTVVNILSKGDFFGERSLLTGEPRAASIRAVETTSCYAFDRDDFPLSSPLSGRTRFTGIDDDWRADVDEKYGVNFAGLYVKEVQSQIQQANAASQTRGSANNPAKIPGVDTEDEVDWDAVIEKRTPSLQQPQSTTTDSIFNLLRRFKMIRHVSKCFDYIALTGARWGESGTRNRRSMLVSRLAPAQLDEYSETFDLIDIDESGQISLLELKRVMESVGNHKTDDELMELISKSVRSTTTTPVNVKEEQSSSSSSSLPGLNKEDFLGIMAEAEFYYLFRDIFQSLDPQDSGFVKARDLDRVLSGTRDLISDDRKSIIDLLGEEDEDLDMLIDYEQFSRMLLG